MKKRLLLVYPNQRWLKDDIGTTWNLNPSTLCLLAAMVRVIVDVKIVDAHFQNISVAELERIIIGYQPDYVGISVLTSEYAETLDMTARIVKLQLPNTVVIAGGVHVTTTYESVINNYDIDYCVIGEGEFVLRGLLLYLDGKGALPSKGLVFRGKDHINVQERVIVNDLTQLPWPAYDLVDFAAYASSTAREFNPQRPPELPYVRMVVTRGCPFGCSFCQVELISGRKVRARDPEDVVNELLFLKETYGIRSVIFDDDNLLMAPGGFAKKLFTLMVAKKLDVKWIGIAFALFLLDDELLDLMRASGCIGINVAIESGNERVLKEIVGKPIKNLGQAKDIIRRIRDRGMYCITNFIVGFPGETWDDIRETIRFAEHCGADYVKFFVAVPLYKTKLFYMARDMGLLECDEEIPKVDWRYAQISSNEWTSKDISILRAYEWDRINFSPEKITKVMEICGVSHEEIQDIRKKTRDSITF